MRHHMRANHLVPCLAHGHILVLPVPKVPSPLPFHHSRSRSRPNSHNVPDSSAGLWFPPPLNTCSKYGLCQQSDHLMTFCLRSFMRCFFENRSILFFYAIVCWAQILNTSLLIKMEHKPCHLSLALPGFILIQMKWALFWNYTDNMNFWIPETGCLRHLRQKGNPGLLWHFTHIA